MRASYTSNVRKITYLLMPTAVFYPEHGMEWNGREIWVWNTEDARMEWNGRFQEWNGKQSFILSYQFHTRFCLRHLQKNIYR